MAEALMLARRELRLAVVEAVETLTGVNVESPGDWDTPPAKLPQIKVRVPSENKVSAARGMPTFTTTVFLELEAKVEADTGEDAQDAIEALVYRIEVAVLSRYGVVALLQQVSSIRTDIAITAEGKRHNGNARMVFGLECFEAYDPSVLLDDLPPLQQVGIHVDTAQPFDAVDTYPDPPFPDAVAPAPRTRGPDGRDEGGLDIQLPE